MAPQTVEAIAAAGLMRLQNNPEFKTWTAWLACIVTAKKKPCSTFTFMDHSILMTPEGYKMLAIQDAR